MELSQTLIHDWDIPIELDAVPLTEKVNERDTFNHPLSNEGLASVAYRL